MGLAASMPENVFPRAIFTKFSDIGTGNDRAREQADAVSAVVHNKI
jgi:hypothetical protein